MPITEKQYRHFLTSLAEHERADARCVHPCPHDLLLQCWQQVCAEAATGRKWARKARLYLERRYGGKLALQLWLKCIPEELPEIEQHLREALCELESELFEKHWALTEVEHKFDRVLNAYTELRDHAGCEQGVGSVSEQECMAEERTEGLTGSDIERRLRELEAELAEKRQVLTEGEHELDRVWGTYTGLRNYIALTYGESPKEERL